MSDMRYKVSSALADAGLSNTQHAKDVLRYLHNKWVVQKLTCIKH